MRRSMRLAAACLLLCLTACARDLVGEANRARRGGDRSKVVATYQEALRTRASLSPAALFDLGLGAFEDGRYPDAVLLFREAADRGRGALAITARYNEGTAAAHEGRLDEALNALRQVLRVEPEWDDARVNYAIVRRWRQRTETSRTPPASRLSEEEVRQILDKVPDAASPFPWPRHPSAGSVKDW